MDDKKTYIYKGPVMSHSIIYLTLILKHKQSLPVLFIPHKPLLELQSLR